jgi:carbamoyl-phosphate synthase large subunit
VTILVTSAGRRVELVRLLQSLDLGKVIAADMSRTAPALYAADAGFLLPALSDANYVDELIRLCGSAGVRWIIPTIDGELEALAKAASDLGELNIRVAVSRPGAVRSCLDKLLCSSLLAAAGVRTIPTRAWDGGPGSLLGQQFPAVVKPRRGSSSRGVRIVSSPAEVGQPSLEEDYIIQPFIKGIEVTVDVVVGHGKVRSIGARKRLKVRGGEVERGVTVDVRRYLDLADTIAGCIGLDGPFNFQVFEHDESECIVNEVNARLGGGMPLSQYAGAKILETMLGLLPDDGLHMAHPGVIMMRYDLSLYARETELLP